MNRAVPVHPLMTTNVFQENKFSFFFLGKFTMMLKCMIYGLILYEDNNNNKSFLQSYLSYAAKQQKSKVGRP